MSHAQVSQSLLPKNLLGYLVGVRARLEQGSDRLAGIRKLSEEREIFGNREMRPIVSQRFSMLLLVFRGMHDRERVSKQLPSCGTGVLIGSLVVEAPSVSEMLGDLRSDPVEYGAPVLNPALLGTHVLDYSWAMGELLNLVQTKASMMP